MVNVLDQLPLHVHRTIFVHSLLDCIAKLFLRYDRVDRSVAALEIDALVFVDTIAVAIWVIGVGRAVSENVTPRAHHNFQGRCLRFEACRVSCAVSPRIRAAKKARS